MTIIAAQRPDKQSTELSNEMHNEPSDEQNNAQGNEPICMHNTEQVTHTHTPRMKDRRMVTLVGCKQVIAIHLHVLNNPQEAIQFDTA